MASEKIIINNEIDLRVILKLLLNKKLYILFVGFLFAIIGIYHALSLPTLYSSTLRIYSNVSESSSSELDDIRGVIGQFGFSNLESSSKLSISDIINSRTFKNLLVDRKWISKKYNYPTNLIDYWMISEVGNKFSFNPLVWIKYLITLPIRLISPSSNSDAAANISTIEYEWKLDALDQLSTRINIDKSNTGVFSISVLMEEPQLASDIANYIYELLLEFYANDFLESARRNKEFIAERKLEVLEKLKIAEETVRDFRERNRDIIGSPYLQLEFGRLERDVSLQTQVFITLSKQLELAKIKELDNKPTIDILDKAMPPIKKDQPHRTKMVLIYIFLGIAVSSIFVLTKSIVKN